MRSNLEEVWHCNLCGRGPGYYNSVGSREYCNPEGFMGSVFFVRWCYEGGTAGLGFTGFNL